MNTWTSDKAQIYSLQYRASHIQGYKIRFQKIHRKKDVVSTEFRDAVFILNLTDQIAAGPGIYPRVFMKSL